ncbi:hypothetical protein B296_00023352 [Ensete ventricosum]|uniref:Uncharacterized protein n=1 Tax=Ensete ventricosum TaxID=4639 RepID=A0A426YM65_ENSVE|nr:hypothetical protein B296_00023352 [Ensete ventricosum]
MTVKGHYNQMLGRNHVRASGQSSDDIVGDCPEFVEGLSMFGRCYQELVESSPEVCQEVCREFTGSLSGVRRQVVGSSPGVRWKNAGIRR